MMTLLHIFALIGYVLAGAVLYASLAGGRRSAPFGGLVAAGLALALHVGGLAAYAARFGELPLVGLAPVLSTAGALVGAWFLAAALFRETRPLGLVLTPISALLVGGALALGLEPAGEPLAFRGWWFVLHVTLSSLGYAALAVAFAAGLLYLLQFRELKGKRFGKIFRFFPPLETLDRLGVLALAVGFPSLTVGLVLGGAWTARFEYPLPPDDPKVLWALLTWVAFVGVFAARLGGAGRDRRGALASVVAFAVVVLAYVALRLGALHEGLFL